MVVLVVYWLHHESASWQHNYGEASRSVRVFSGGVLVEGHIDMLKALLVRYMVTGRIFPSSLIMHFLDER